MGYLLDTNIISHMVRNPASPASVRIAGLADRPTTSIIVAAELRFGVARSGSSRLEVQLDKVLGGIEILPFAQPAERFYGEIRTELERTGRLIGPHDLLIAAHALALDHVLITDNIREFARVPRLRIENWLR